MTVFAVAVNGVTRCWSSKQAEQPLQPGKSFTGYHGDPRAIVAISKENAWMNSNTRVKNKRSENWE